MVPASAHRLAESKATRVSRRHRCSSLRTPSHDPCGISTTTRWASCWTPTISPITRCSDTLQCRNKDLSAPARWHRPPTQSRRALGAAHVGRRSCQAQSQSQFQVGAPVQDTVRAGGDGHMCRAHKRRSAAGNWRAGQNIRDDRAKLFPCKGTQRRCKKASAGCCQHQRRLGRCLDEGGAPSCFPRTKDSDCTRGHTGWPDTETQVSAVYDCRPCLCPCANMLQHPRTQKSHTRSRRRVPSSFGTLRLPSTATCYTSIPHTRGMSKAIAICLCMDRSRSR